MKHDQRRAHDNRRSSQYDLADADLDQISGGNPISTIQYALRDSYLETNQDLQFLKKKSPTFF